MLFNLNFKKMLCLSLMIISTFYVISCNSLLNCWIGLEINLMSFIFLLYKSYNPLMSESSLKYFLVQVIASSNFIFVVIMSSLFFMSMNLMMIMIKILLTLSLIMKMGAAPFHFWFPSVSESLSWDNLLILMTWQKINPMILIFYVQNSFILKMSIIMSAFIGAIGGLNQTLIKKILSYSSINHMSWMMFNLLTNLNIWKIYFLTYTLINISLIYFLNKLNLNFIHQIFFLKFPNSLKLIFSLNFMTLGGLPPLLGFLPKWLTIKMSFMSQMNFILIILIMSSLITLFFYLKITYNNFLSSHLNFINNTQFFKFNFFNLKFLLLNIVSLNFISLLFLYL
uniref:NADH dehydrogenase subunit 2 n=1 Tax=Oxyethira ecornuta TaxID=1401674 RepID=UPI0022DCDA4A|nr:NADH dehydrogenase subunit 2 [Oxyethira ecornuta]UZZ44234.1 NADH dehydrogenase subunit 2 [Oxyethira ecornuta]